ncbi:semaphorin-6B-like, partial [Anneissia japonica]|uniref:semaphorin-6B-like n=1 Tax=Anneissia japonica TaxID=1529436 RepID=UPI0014256ACB
MWGGYPPLISKKSDSIWLNDLVFVGSYQEDNEVYLFFREISIETQFTEKMYYSRIARVCTQDRGGNSAVLESTWTSFLKARLDCSFRGDFTFHFNYLQDVARVVEGKKIFYYAIFTTGDHEMPASAVCRFDLDHIRDNFDNCLLKLTKCPWSPIADSQRGGCSASDSRRLSHDNLNFIKSHPLMYEPVVGEDPLFTLVRKRYRLKTLVVRTSQHHTVVFAGTDDGRVLKLVARQESPSVLLYNVRVIGQPITNMR